MTDDNFFSTTRRAWLGAMLGAAATGVGAQGTSAFPTKPVKFVVPFPAGGATDLTGRLLAGMMS